MEERLEITFPQLEQKVRELVAANPTYMYPARNYGGAMSCVYNATGTQPPCIFGRAFSELGFPVPMDCEGKGIENVMQRLLAGEIKKSDFVWARNMQMQQDSGVAWGDCLDWADRRRAEYINLHRELTTE